jgi:soluble epoxide hydrolase/lipid-phosphate phosphatase
MNVDIRKSIRSCAQTANSTIPVDFLTSTTNFLGAWNTHLSANHLSQIPASGIMTQLVEDYMVLSYSKQGFHNTYNGYQYQNRKITFDFGVAQGNVTIPQPTFTLRPTADPVANWVQLAGIVGEANFLTNHQTAEIPSAHWPQEELPDQFNSILSTWLTAQGL